MLMFKLSDQNHVILLRFQGKILNTTKLIHADILLNLSKPPSKHQSEILSLQNYTVPQLGQTIIVYICRNKTLANKKEFNFHLCRFTYYLSPNMVATKAISVARSLKLSNVDLC